MLPGMGTDSKVCRELRRSASNVPVPTLTARDAVESRISGLDSGADDYRIKPFDFGERPRSLARALILARPVAVDARGSRPLGIYVCDLRARQAYRQDLRPQN